MDQDKSITNLQRTRKHTCLKSMGDQALSPEEKLKKFNEMVRQIGNQTTCYDTNCGRRTKSELCLTNGCHQFQKQLTDDEFTVMEILAGDANQIYFNENDTKSEEFVI